MQPRPLLGGQDGRPCQQSIAEASGGLVRVAVLERRGECPVVAVAVGEPAEDRWCSSPFVDFDE